jgi:hypothetical protein
MTKEMTKHEYRMTKGSPAAGFGLRHFLRPSSFLRHSSFVIRHFPLLIACLAVAQSIPEVDDTPEPATPWDWSRGRGMPEAIREEFGMMVPLGRPHEGVRYPVYNRRVGEKAPRREAELNAQRVERVAEELIQLDGVDFTSYGDAREPDKVTRTVKMTRAWYDLACDFLYTSQPVDIVDGDQHIRSGRMLYDRASGLTIFEGGVEVHFTEDGTAPTIPPHPAPAPGASKP